MSLISLASISRNDKTQQDPSNFRNFFPQPIKIKPHSQVCLNSFYHFRDDSVFRVNNNNNLIGFMVGASRSSFPMMYAEVPVGEYTPADLATAIATAMNSVCIFENYLFTCVFAAGNPNANPITHDTFTITYTDVATPASKGGIFVSRTAQFEGAEVGGGTTASITLNDTDGGAAFVLCRTDERCVVEVPNGLRLHEGEFEVDDIKMGNTSGNYDPQNAKPHELLVGFAQSRISGQENVKDGKINTDLGFMDFLVDLKTVGDVSTLTISNMIKNAGRAGATNYPADYTQEVRRVFTAANLAALFAPSDMMKLILGKSSKATAAGHNFYVKVQKSTDGGASYADIAAGTGGNNADGGQLVYDGDVATGQAFTSLLYSTNGIVQTGTTTIVNCPASGQTTRSVNRALPRYAPFIPILSIPKRYFNIIDTNFDNQLFSPQGFGTGVSNDYVMKMTPDTTNGYSYVLAVENAETTPDDQLPSSANLNGFALGKTGLGSSASLIMDVYANNGTVRAAATIIGRFVCDPYTGAANVMDAQLTTGLNGHTAFTTNPCNFRFQTAADVFPTLSVQTRLALAGIFNQEKREPKILNTHLSINKDTNLESANSLTILDEGVDLGLEGSTALGADLDAKTTYYLSKMSQATRGANVGVPLLANRTEPQTNGSLLDPTIGGLIGFTESVINQDAGARQIVSDTLCDGQSKDDTIHISINELPRVVSAEGENEGIGKTIKVIPKSDFRVDETTMAMTYQAPYEDWVDINNADTLYLNEFTTQVRRPDMTLATTLKPITRATIKIRQDPAHVHKEQMNAMFDRLALNQNTYNELVAKKTYT
jgi:hypothetical protein